MARDDVRKLSAEFLGTMVLMIFGVAVNAQVTLGSHSIGAGAIGAGASVAGESVDRAFGDFLSINAGWGLAVMFGVYVAGAVSGAHLNPAVTIALAVFRNFPWRLVGPYIVVQVLAAVAASAIVYGTYREAIDNHETTRSQQIATTASEAVPPSDAQLNDAKHDARMETAGIFATYPKSFLSTAGGLIDQIVGTAMLLLCIMAATDPRNSPPGANLAPAVIGASVFAIGMTFGYNCGYAINPARDFGPRIFTYMAGWGSDVFTAGNGFWWIPIVGPVIGGVVGVAVYDAFVGKRHPVD